jgi:hypothetical protein
MEVTDESGIDYASEDYAAGYRDGHDLGTSVRKSLQEQLTTTRAELAAKDARAQALEGEVARLREALNAIAAWDDKRADAYRAAHGSYAAFCEPSAVKTARAALTERPND